VRHPESKQGARLLPNTTSSNLWVVVSGDEQIGSEMGFRAAVEWCNTLQASNPEQTFSVEPVWDAEAIDEEPILAEVDE
jgi:hypothetical protein